MKRFEIMSKEEISEILNHNTDTYCAKCTINPLNLEDNPNCYKCIVEYLNEDISGKTRISLINSPEQLNEQFKTFQNMCEDEKCYACKYNAEYKGDDCFVNFLNEVIE